MKITLIIFVFFVFACKSEKNQNMDSDTKANSTELSEEVADISCDQDICIQLKNHDLLNKTFDIYMQNSKPVAGFQCDFSTIDITGSDGGLLKEYGYQTSTNGARVLSFSMQAKLIEVGEGVLTKIIYSGDPNEVCMTQIIFAGAGANKLSNNLPDCISLQ